MKLLCMLARVYICYSVVFVFLYININNAFEIHKQVKTNDKMFRRLGDHDAIIKEGINEREIKKGT